MLKCENKYLQSNLSQEFGGEAHAINVRELAERILSIRSHLAEEWRQDLMEVKEDNADLLRYDHPSRPHSVHAEQLMIPGNVGRLFYHHLSLNHTLMRNIAVLQTTTCFADGMQL